MRALVLLGAFALFLVGNLVGGAFGTVGPAICASSLDAVGGVAVDPGLVTGAGSTAGWLIVSLVLAVGAAWVWLRWIETALTIPPAPMYAGDGPVAIGAVLLPHDEA